MLRCHQIITSLHDNIKRMWMSYNIYVKVLTFTRIVFYSFQYKYNLWKTMNKREGKYFELWSFK